MLIHSVEIYPAVKNLQPLVGFTFSFPTKVTGKTQSIKSPEKHLVSLIVIATKLLFPLDGKERHPFSANEPTAQVMDWKAWVRAQRNISSRETSAGHIGKGNEIFATEKDVFSMTPTQMDEYMDWYETQWLDTGVSKGIRPNEHTINC